METQFRDITIALPIADRARSMTFYTRVFGFEPVGPIADDGMPEPLQFRLGQNTLLMLVPVGGFGWVLGDRQIADHAVTESLLGFTCESVTEVRTLCDKVLATGGQILKEPDSAPWGYSALCLDPDGHAWELVVA